MISSVLRVRTVSRSCCPSSGKHQGCSASLSLCTDSCRPSTSSSAGITCDATSHPTSHRSQYSQRQSSRQMQCRVRCQASSSERDEQAEDDDVDEEQPASRIVAELSQMVSDEAVYFMFQLDLDTQLQRCLNYKAYELANEVRIKRQKVDEIIRAMKERKAAANASSAPPAGVSPADGRLLLTVADFAAEGLRLRSEMQRAVEDERYGDAAKYRDLLARLQTESNKVEAANEEWNGGVQPILRLGQRVVHKQHGYRAVVTGWDLRCCESGEWQQLAGVQEYTRGARQPFYHLLIDMQDFSRFDSPMMMPPVSYVAEELLTAPELEGQEPSTAAAEDEASDGGSAGGTSSSSSSTPVAGRSWVEEYGEDGLEHTYLYILFLGQDARGDYIPCRQLRDKYNVQRRDVYRPGQDGTFDEGDGDKPDDPKPQS